MAEMSSAKSRSENLFWPHSIPKLAPSIDLVMIKSMVMRKRKGGENATLPHSSLNIEHIGISNACFHTAAGINGYVGTFVWDPVKFQYFPE